MKIHQLPKAGFQEIIFDEFFDSGKEESVSPFITASTRYLGKNLPLKSSLIAALCLITSFLMPAYAGLSLLFAYFFAGVPALIDAVEDIFKFEINIDVLMTLAAFLSILIGIGWEGALLLVLFSFSGAIEEAVTQRAKGNLSNIKKLAPTKACVVQPDHTTLERSVKDISQGDTILVKPGEIVPLDGVIVHGSSYVNLVHLTGESLPLSKKEGDEVPAGANNLDGSLTIKVLRKSSDSTIERIVKLIAEAESARPKLQRFFDKFSNRYATFVILFSALVALFLPSLFGIPFVGKEGSIYRALAFLIAASPCALIIALPIAYLSSISAAAYQGILLKGGIVLDALSSCKTIAFDKTGTLTEGVLECVGIIGGKEVDKAMRAAVALERNSTHPIAHAIVRYGKDVKPALLTTFESIAGFGLQGELEGESLYIGNRDFILSKLSPERHSSLLEPIKAIELQGEVYTILLMGEELFFFRFKDQLRGGALETVTTLQHECGKHVVMLTGDHASSAKRVASQLGIKNFYADLRPEEKLSKIAELAKKENLAMVGDGINDAPALARATVGISMGKGGSRAAVDASDIVLLQDNITQLPWLVKKARLTKKIVGQNLFVALSAIGVATILALGGLIPLWLAVVAHEGGTVIVGLNALRLLKK